MFKELFTESEEYSNGDKFEVLKPFNFSIYDGFDMRKTKKIVSIYKVKKGDVITYGSVKHKDWGYDISFKIRDKAGNDVAVGTSRSSYEEMDGPYNKPIADKTLRKI